MSAERRQITDVGKEQVLRKHGRNCFVNGYPIPLAYNQDV